MDIYRISKEKGKFFEVLGQTPRSQLAVMTIGAGRDSGPEETHEGDQIVYVIEGEADIAIAGEEGKLRAGDAAIIPAGARHHIWNNGESDLFFLNIYTPPEY